MRADDINSLESESGIIATLFHHPDFYFYSEHLLPNHFTNKENQCVYTAIAGLVKSGIYTIDSYNILEFLNSGDATRKFADELSIDKLNELMDMSDVLARNTVEEYKLLVSNVMDAAFRRDTFTALMDCVGMCVKREEDQLEKKIYSTIDDVMLAYSSTDEIPEFGEVVDDLWQEIIDHQDGKDAGIPFKFPILNEYVRIEPGELVVVGAPAKGAKSMFMLNEAVDILRQGKSVFYLDSELSSRLFLCRMISHLTGIEFVRVRSGRYTEEEEQRIKEQLLWIKQQRFVHMYLPSFNCNTIYTAVKKIYHRFGKLDVLICDYLKPNGNNTEAYAVYSELGNLADLLKNSLCGSLGIAGLAAAQLNNQNKIADSAKIVRNASTIMLLLDKTPEECEEDGENSGRKKLIVTQNRNGMQHVDGEWINLDFNGNICTLTESQTQHHKEEPF